MSSVSYWGFNRSLPILPSLFFTKQNLVYHPLKLRPFEPDIFDFVQV